MLQLVLYLRANQHQLVAVNQQLPQVFLFARRRPDPRKPPFHQQLQNQRCVAPVVLLPPYLAGTNLRRIADPQTTDSCRSTPSRSECAPIVADKIARPLPLRVLVSSRPSLQSPCPANKSV